MNWLNRLLRRGQMEDQLDRELRFHLEEYAADLVARGERPEEARRQAQLVLGGAEQIKEDCRDARGTRWAEDFAHDFRYSLRALRQNPGFTAVALFTLALGIGATTVMATLVHSVLLKPLPYPQPDRLVAVHGMETKWNVALYGDENISNFDFRDLQRQSRSLALTGWVFDNGTLSEPGDAEYVTVFDASANLFSIFGVRPAAGRAFLPDEDRPGGTPVAILGYSLWKKHFGGSASALGTSLVLDTVRYTIVGIAPERFEPNGVEPDVITPLGQNTEPYLMRRGPHPVTAVGRLMPGATLAQAQNEMALLGHRLAAQYPDTNKERSFAARRLAANVADVRSTLWLLFGAVTLVLLITCADVASLLLARAVSRTREFAMRVALGAGRGRLIRQCLTESSVLAVAGGALGVVLAALGVRPFVAAWPGELPRADEVSLDWRVLGFAVLVSVASGLIFGLAPALRAPSSNLEQTMRGGGRILSGSGRLHGAFVACEMALAVVLLVSAGMLGNTLLRLSVVQPGLDVHNVLTARTALSPAVLTSPQQTRAMWDELLDRVRHVPGVEAAAMVDTVPMRNGNNPLGYWLAPPAPPDNRMPLALANSVSPDYLKVMRIPLLRGRFFDEHDTPASEPVIVIDEVMAEHAFGKDDPVGKQIWSQMGPQPARVIGVVGHVRYYGPANDDKTQVRDQAQVRDQFYYPFGQLPDRFVRRWSQLMSIAVRTRIDPQALVEPLKSEFRAVSRDQVLYRVATMEQLARATIEPQRFLLLLFSVFAGLALLLATVGNYGVLAYLTRQRTAEIGVRLALGASAASVMRMVLRQSMTMVTLGIIAGTAGAIAAGRILQTAVDGMAAMDPYTVASMIAILVCAALVASLIPARRAARIDPMRALRG